MTLLQDFEQFVKDAESGTQYIKWSKDNPGDLTRWVAYSDSIISGGTPTYPTMTTPRGRELADGGKLYLDAIAATTPPTPTPTPPPVPTPTPGTKNLGNGFVCNLQGSTYAQMTETERANYGGIVVGFGNEIDVARFGVAHPSCHGFGYQTSVESSGAFHWYGGVDEATARANGWVLKNAAGKEITNGQGLLMLDVGNPDYQKAWCNYEKSRAAVTGLKFKFLDNVTGTLMVGGWFDSTPINPRTKTAYTDSTWGADYLSMLKAQNDLLPDFYRVANAYAPDRLSWWKYIVNYVDAIFLEYYDGSGTHNDCLKACVSAGKDPFAIVDPGRYSAPGPDDSAGILLAKTFNSATAGRRGGGFGFNGVNVWRSGPGTWTAQIS